MKSRSCPVCDGDNAGKWTCASCTVIVNVHRELIRNLQVWRSLYEASEVEDVLIGPDGRSYGLWDIERLYEARTRLPQQMQRSMELCWYENVLEKDAAERMGVSRSNPVGVYATVGLTRLLGLAYTGDLPGYRLRLEDVPSPS